MTLFAPQDRAWGDSENSSSNNIGGQQQEQKKNDCFDTSFSSSSIVEPSQRRNDDECCYNDDNSSGGGDGDGGCDDVIGKAHTATHTTQGEFTATIIPSEIQCKVLSSSSGGGGSNSAVAAAAASSVNSVCGFGSENGFSNLSSLYADGQHQYEQQLSLQQQRIVNKNICIKLLRSGWYDDNCLGIERLMAISNYELVNTQFDENSIAYAFTSRTKNKNNNKRSNDDDDDDKFSKWLRNLFLSFFCDQQQHHHQRSNRTKTINSCDKEEVDVYGFSDSTEAHHHHQKKRTRLSLKVPALRILISSLELISRTQQQQKTKTKSSSSTSSSSSSIDILDKFWKSMLAYMTECLQDLVLHDDEQQPGTTETKSTSNTSTSASASTISSDFIEAALVVKGIRLLQRIEPTMMRPYVRYSLLPYISNAKEIFDGQQSTSTSTSTSTTCCM